MSPKRAHSEDGSLSVTILRVPKREKYFKVANSVFSDSRLSWEARGVMGYLLSKPDDWQVRLHDLIRQGPAGEHKMRRILRQLEAARYLHRERFRRADGTFDWFFVIFEDPSLARALG